ncbi:MAG TPA: hypothetical protein VGD75_20595 [Bradyrhizobium sp.]|jgi:hypothetical protein
MRKTLVTIFCSVLIAASSIQMAAAAQHHAARHQVRNAVSGAATNEQFRNSYASQVRGSNGSGMCGLFPGPCQ